MNLYENYIQKKRELSSFIAELTDYVCNFFEKRNIGVHVILQEGSVIEIKTRLRRDLDFCKQTRAFYKAVDELCSDLNLKTTYRESLRWDPCLQMPIFGEEKVYLIGDSV